MQAVQYHTAMIAAGNQTEQRTTGVSALLCSLFGQDVLEFVIKPDKPSGQLVTYRSMAGSVKYIWPIQVGRAALLGHSTAAAWLAAYVSSVCSCMPDVHCASIFEHVTLTSKNC